ncbi:MAG: hypothetical protein H6741_26460 [Alphaproteobacteria bacterium]|nr:hypothetical protein [Alphaproteobacteria bacterium]MCB9796252.1 hypothetical protein [Alphaproteobacteria bacterium]
MRRLPRAIPQDTDAPESMRRALYKASTGSYKASLMLRLAQSALVVATFGHEVYEDEPVARWAADLAARLPPPPEPETLLAAAVEDDLVTPGSREAQLLASALEACRQRWEGPHLMAICVREAWADCDVDPLSVVQGFITVLSLFEMLDADEAAERLTEHLLAEEPPSHWDARDLGETLRLLRASEAALARASERLPADLRQAFEEG